MFSNATRTRLNNQAELNARGTLVLSLVSLLGTNLNLRNYDRMRNSYCLNSAPHMKLRKFSKLTFLSNLVVKTFTCSFVLLTSSFFGSINPLENSEKGNRYKSR